MKQRALFTGNPKTSLTQTDCAGKRGGSNKSRNVAGAAGESHTSARLAVIRGHAQDKANIRLSISNPELLAEGNAFRS